MRNMVANTKTNRTENAELRKLIKKGRKNNE